MQSLLAPTNVPQSSWIDNSTITPPPTSTIKKHGYSQVKIKALLEQPYRANIMDTSGPMPAHDDIVLDPYKGGYSHTLELEVAATLGTPKTWTLPQRFTVSHLLTNPCQHLWQALLPDRE
eukprot:6344303-Ditylum_brightwellii.AAC.1